MNIRQSFFAKAVLFLFLNLLLGFTSGSYSSGAEVFKMPENISKKDYVPGEIIFKMKPQVAESCHKDKIAIPSFEKILKDHDAEHLHKIFPNHKPPAKKYHFSGQPYADLSLIYQVNIPQEKSLEKVINKLLQTGMIEYAQPRYVPKLFYEPNDPFIESQYYLDNIMAYDAWAIEQGDTNIVVAIIDTGIDLYHPDLINDIAYNYDDPLNGEDNDNDGYVDNFYGWDFGEGNNDPQYNVNAHGVHVAGIAGASTDNGTGMAGVGFHSRLLPVKISDEDGRLVRAYEGIVYAADQGAQVINCSWGGSISPGQFGQDIVNYAVLNQDALVIAAAGNADNQVRIFPASYNNAVSVAATNSDDVKWSGSSFGKLVDISAPGANIFSTWPNTYISSSGTSMAAPVVSGAAALLRSHFPDYNALQIAAQLKVTTDVIDTIAANEPYSGLLGTGRINIFRALSETHHPFMLMTQLQNDDEYYQLYNPGESFELGAEFINLLDSASHISATLSSESEYIEIIENESELGAVNHMETINNFMNPFYIRIKENIPPSQEVTFTINFYNQDNTFAGEQSFSMTFNLDYVDFQVNQISTTVNSRGNLGYNYPNYNQGLGFIYENTNQNRTMIKCAGFITGTSTSHVVDNIYGSVEDSFTNAFYSLINARIQAEPELGDIHIKGAFNDSLAQAQRLQIQVDYDIVAFHNSPADKFLILEYHIINQSENNLPGLHAGFFTDWVIQDVRNHRASFDPENQIGYAYSASGGNYTGIRLLNHTNINHYAFDNQGFGGSLRIDNGFTTFEKYTAMQSNRPNAGLYDKDNDISTLLATGPFNLLPGDTLTVAFALMAGDHLNDLQATAQLASYIYDGDHTSSVEVDQPGVFNIHLYPNPASSQVNVKFSPHLNQQTHLTVYNINGKQVYSYNITTPEQHKATHSFNIEDWPPGIYLLQLNNGHKTETIRFLK